MYFLLPLILLAVAEPSASPSTQPLAAADVISLLGNDEWTATGALQRLLEIGDQAFPVYERLLDSPDTDRFRLVHVMYVVARVDGARRRFVRPTSQLLTDPRLAVRESAATLLGVIGDASVSGQLLPLLNDRALEIRCAAAAALGCIGGPAEKAALIHWRTNSTDEPTNPAVRAVNAAIEQIDARLRPRRDKG